MVWIGFRRTPREFHIGDRQLLLMIGLVFALMGFRLGLNNQDSNVIDVGYAGVAGASRLMDGVLPYGHMPDRDGHPCHGRYFNGDPIGYIQTDGRCESPIESGDTYGPAVYVAYVPAVAAMGWSGIWDRLPAAHVAASAFDILAVAGLFVAGWRLGSRRLGVALAFAWAANPFTLYSLNMNSNDALVGALVAWTLAVLVVPGRARGAPGGGGPDQVRAPRDACRCSRRCATASRRWSGSPSPRSCCCRCSRSTPTARSLFWHRTIDYQLGRVTPMSIWTLGTYHPGWWDLRLLQHVVQFAAVLGAVALAVFPRHRKDAAAVAAFSGAVVIAVQIGGELLVLPLHLLVAARRDDRAARARAPRPRPRSRGYSSIRTGSIDVARPSASHSMSTPSRRTPPSAGSNRTGIWVVKRRRIRSVRTPITESCGPVMPASVM